MPKFFNLKDFKDNNMRNKRISKKNYQELYDFFEYLDVRSHLKYLLKPLSFRICKTYKRLLSRSQSNQFSFLYRKFFLYARESFYRNKFKQNLTKISKKLFAWLFKPKEDLIKGLNPKYLEKKIPFFLSQIGSIALRYKFPF